MNPPPAAPTEGGGAGRRGGPGPGPSTGPGERRARWWGRRVRRGVGVAVLAVVAYVGVTAVQVWGASGRDDIQAVDAIVVLGAAQYDGQPSPVLEARLRHAFTLYSHDVAPLVVVTGGRQAGDTFTEATAGYNWLRQRGVPDTAILREVQGQNTFDSLAATARILQADGLDVVVLVSSGYHALRVEGTAREVGMRPHVSSVAVGRAPLAQLARETLAVSIGRITGFRRLTRLGG